MNKLLLTLLVGLISTSSLLAQVQNDVKKILASKDFIAFKKYADNLSNKEKRISSHWECLRDLTNEFQEGVFIFEKSVPDKDNPSSFSVYRFRVKLVTTDKNIAYYELSEKKYKKVGNEWENYFEILEKFKNDKAFDKLKISFKSIYQTDINENELFIIDFVYGKHCGFAGINPTGREQIEEWITAKNKTELLKWLTSTNTEKQVYAVDGLFQLNKMGVRLTDKEVKIINFICHKNGTIYICGGCMYSRQDIKSVTEKFKL
ncbi:hypothetical protein V9L05_10910 [Bernardetia sp. Wsw4-3y2]|uniref:hypothetical protein n=1 Tax=Bernardetia sp. Wsw4-3y2 TaxID=3127471 RepID=UPI0030D21A4E